MGFIKRCAMVISLRATDFGRGRLSWSILYDRYTDSQLGYYTPKSSLRRDKDVRITRTRRKDIVLTAQDGLGAHLSRLYPRG